tara:strand:+ start:192 stop:500 length:309 start_codon:yes stop_codon:yes gene_type:complete
MSNYAPEYALKIRRISAVKKALNTPNLPQDMQNYWQTVLTHLTRRKPMIENKPEIVLKQLQQGMEEIIFLLEEIHRILKKNADPEKRNNVTNLSDRADSKHH